MEYLNYFTKDCFKYFSPSKLANKKILVVGCGNGQDCADFIECQVVHGLDICENLGHSFSHPKVSYYQESAEFMLRPSDFYDLVFSVATLEHIHNLEAAFSEILRVTKPGGLIYCASAPLWHSYQGHHLNYYGLFTEFPWIHLRLCQSEMLQYIREYKQVSDLQSWIDLLEQENLLSAPLKINDLNSYAENVANFVFSDYFNRQPASQYLKTAEVLEVSYRLRNDLWQEGETLLTPDILQELTEKGFTQDELLAVSHTYVAIK